MLQLDSPALSPLLKRLAAAELITRTRSADDERQLDIELTQLDIDISERESIHGALTKVITAAGQAGTTEV
jgi:DNA-binding MarR family transcriptional regulator